VNPRSRVLTFAQGCDALYVGMERRSRGRLLNNVSRSIGVVPRPARLKTPRGFATDPTWSEDPAFREWSAFMDRYYPGGDKTDNLTAVSYAAAQTLVRVLERCGDDLTSDNVLRQATNLHEFRLRMLLPGITISTGPNDYAPLKQMPMMRFTGGREELFGRVPQGEIASY
jgi:branched-chain amino acid transport system substrate-binding protein